MVATAGGTGLYLGRSDRRAAAKQQPASSAPRAYKANGEDWSESVMSSHLVPRCCCCCCWHALSEQELQKNKDLLGEKKDGGGHCIYGHAAHGPATRPTARPFGTAHGRHGTSVGAPVPARPGAPCSAWAAGLAHDTARARQLFFVLLKIILFLYNSLLFFVLSCEMKVMSLI